MAASRPSVGLRSRFYCILAAALVAGAVVARAPDRTASPADLFQELFARVQTESLFEDSKSFADAIPNDAPDKVLSAYRAQKPPNRDALAEFVRSRFIMPAAAEVPPAPAAARSLRDHIAQLWPHLIRRPAQPPRYSSQLAFDFPYVVPGGRFREIYYWDSYFTMLGLMRDGHADVAQGMVAGFADLVARYGHVPNGTRSYYLSRSQPPFFSLMVGMLTPQQPQMSYAKYLPALRAEHAFWMAGAETLKPGTASEHVVMLPGGEVLNRYWDRRDTPRDESYREDVALAQKSGRPPAELYREIRSAAESGWDFSSRWFADGRKLETIETTAIVPVDLNALLYGLEQAIAQGCTQQKDAACTKDYSTRAERRKAAINQYLWLASCGCYLDYHWRRGKPTQRLSAATLYPLFVGAADAAQAAAVARTVRERLLTRGGVATTTQKTGQQWDAPNGWAPLQWIAVSGLNAYDQRELASVIAGRWLQTVEISFKARGKLVEKYDVETQSPGSGGEYPLQDGFGWTNGVTRALLDVYKVQ
jgi:alpha,alpha-trehalase